MAMCSRNTYVASITSRLLVTRKHKPSYMSNSEEAVALIRSSCRCHKDGYNGERDDTCWSSLLATVLCRHQHGHSVGILMDQIQSFRADLEQKLLS